MDSVDEERKQMKQERKRGERSTAATEIAADLKGSMHVCYVVNERTAPWTLGLGLFSFARIKDKNTKYLWVDQRIKRMNKNRGTHIKFYIQRL